MTEQVILLIYAGRLKKAAKLYSQEKGITLKQATFEVNEACIELLFV
jgi:hypothetical protein